jgi:ABC-type Fe3+-hydroxamate transport system substrate-binding protein
MIDKVAGPAIALPLTPDEWRLQMKTVAQVIGIRAAARINAHVAALEQRIEALEKAKDQVPGPGIRRFRQ